MKPRYLGIPGAGRYSRVWQSERGPERPMDGGAREPPQTGTLGTWEAARRAELQATRLATSSQTTAAASTFDLSTKLQQYPTFSRPPLGLTRQHDRLYLSIGVNSSHYDALTRYRLLCTSIPSVPAVRAHHNVLCLHDRCCALYASVYLCVWTSCFCGV